MGKYTEFLQCGLKHLYGRVSDCGPGNRDLERAIAHSNDTINIISFVAKIQGYYYLPVRNRSAKQEGAAEL